MTCKDFEVIALGIREGLRRIEENRQGVDAVSASILVDAIADALATCNPLFDPERFRTAVFRNEVKR